MLPRPVKIKLEKRDSVRQGIISDDGCTANCIENKLQG